MICPYDGAVLMPHLLSFDQHDCRHDADYPGRTAQAWGGLSEVSGMTFLGGDRDISQDAFYEAQT